MAPARVTPGARSQICHTVQPAPWICLRPPGAQIPIEMTILIEVLVGVLLHGRRRGPALSPTLRLVLVRVVKVTLLGVTRLR